MESIIKDYASYRETSLVNQSFKHQDILSLIKRLPLNPQVAVEKLGASFEGRPLHRIQIGQGKRHILFWSQMHGDEPTATAAIFDLINCLLSDHHSEHAGIKRDYWLSELSLHFVPMLNPDGAERFRRRNAQSIDINRDALQLQSPEGRILDQLIKTWQPEFSFNLHDQSREYTAGYTANPATLSFLAPAFNVHKDINPTRLKAMQLIGLLNEKLSPYAANHIGKYEDEYEPRAFGENIQNANSSTILIESGGFANDPHRQTARRLNFIAFLTAIDAIAHNHYRDYSQDAYHLIPFNNRGHFDLIIRNVNSGTNPAYRLDIGINLEHPEGHTLAPSCKGIIADMGDLSVFHGYEELDASELSLCQDTILEVDKEATFQLRDGDRILYSIENGMVINNKALNKT